MKRLPLLVLILFSLFSTGPLFAGSIMALLEYHPKDGKVEETTKFADRLREEFQRRFGGAILTKGETEDLFFYHEGSVLEKTRFASKPLLEEGKKNYFELKFTEAERNFQELISKEAEEGVVEATLLLGLTRFAKGEAQGSREAFEEALRQSPGMKLDPEFFPPKMIRFFDRVAQETKLPGGTLSVEAEPLGSEVWINGVFRGLVPLHLENFPAGRHTVRIRANHYRPVVRRIELRPDSEEKVKGNLSWESGRPTRRVLGFRESEIGGGEKLTSIASTVGREMGLSKVLFVSFRKVDGKGEVETRLVDVGLRSSHRLQNFPAAAIEEKSAEISKGVADLMVTELRHDLSADPGRYAENRFEGDIILIGKRRRPLYKKPLFWVFVGAAGAGGGISAGVLSGGSASTGSIGIAFQ